jgi:hypothetical protein
VNFRGKDGKQQSRERGEYRRNQFNVCLTRNTLDFISLGDKTLHSIYPTLSVGVWKINYNFAHPDHKVFFFFSWLS